MIQCYSDGFTTQVTVTVGAAQDRLLMEEFVCSSLCLTMTPKLGVGPHKCLAGQLWQLECVREKVIEKQAVKPLVRMMHCNK